MLFPALPKNESGRIQQLRNLRILDTESEKVYNDLVELAAQICDAPIALISLVDSNRQWFKAKVGLAICETARDISFCAHAILHDEPLIVEDASLDSRFADNPLVTSGLKVRFYAGIPIIMSGSFHIGTLCVIDVKAKVLTKQQAKSLQILGSQVTALFEARAMELEKLRLDLCVEEQKLKVMEGSKMAALGEMAANIAHEINNPLSAILGWSGTINQMTIRSDLDTKKLQNAAASIERLALRISKTIRSLRAFSRDGSTTKSEPFRLKIIVAETLELCLQRFKESNVELRVTMPPEELMVKCRPVEISQVLLNLLNNAFDSVSHREEKWVECTYELVGENVEICVRDSGPALPPELIEKIMTPFFTTKPPGKGTGLGLSISQRIAQSHGGTLSIDKADEHVMFRLRLPA